MRTQRYWRNYASKISEPILTYLSANSPRPAQIPEDLSQPFQE